MKNTLHVLKPDNYAKILEKLEAGAWVLACFCAGWCNNCRNYKPTFRKLTETYPDVVFLWIDIEDNAELLDDIDIEKFPHLLIQHQDTVCFFGCVHPDAQQASRLLRSQMDMTPAEMEKWAFGNPERESWQSLANLRTLLRAVVV